ncbi:hypothetical protein IWZ01DRAFT_137573 [Phyllosticta capitalensis]
MMMMGHGIACPAGQSLERASQQTDTCTTSLPLSDGMVGCGRGLPEGFGSSSTRVRRRRRRALLLSRLLLLLLPFATARGNQRLHHEIRTNSRCYCCSTATWSAGTRPSTRNLWSRKMMPCMFASRALSLFLVDGDTTGKRHQELGARARERDGENAKCMSVMMSRTVDQVIGSVVGLGPGRSVRSSSECVSELHPPRPARIKRHRRRSECAKQPAFGHGERDQRRVNETMPPGAARRVRVRTRASC